MKSCDYCDWWKASSSTIEMKQWNNVKNVDWDTRNSKEHEQSNHKYKWSKKAQCVDDFAYLSPGNNGRLFSNVFTFSESIFNNSANMQPTGNRFQIIRSMGIIKKFIWIHIVDQRGGGELR